MGGTCEQKQVVVFVNYFHFVIARFWKSCYDVLERQVLELMLYYTIEEIRRYTERIRERLNDLPRAPDDQKALEIIEDYVFSRAKAASCSHQVNSQLIRRLFLSLRREMGILQPLVDDAGISEIMVNGIDRIFVERSGAIEEIPFRFDSEDELEELIRRIAARVHREINELNPIVDARLSDGSRVNAVLKGVAVNGPILTIRKFPESALTMRDLIGNGTIPEDAAAFLTELVKARFNIFISGGTSSGKTTFLNVLSQSVPSDERVVVIEDSAELQIDHIPNIVRLECRNANVSGRGAIDMARLVRNSLRMRPDRIIVGEVRGGEVLDMIQAMNTGHAGSMSTGHANSIEGMLKRLEAMFLQAAEIPVEAIRSQISEGIDIIVHMSRLSDGSRRVIEIAELDAPSQGAIRTNRLYHRSTGLTGASLLHGEKLDMWGPDTGGIPEVRG